MSECVLGFGVWMCGGRWEGGSCDEIFIIHQKLASIGFIWKFALVHATLIPSVQSCMHVVALPQSRIACDQTNNDIQQNRKIDYFFTMFVCHMPLDSHS